MNRLQDAASFTKAQHHTKEMLETAWLIRPEYIQSRGWSAILVPGSVSDQDDEPLPTLLAAMDAHESNGYFGLVTEGPGVPETFTAALRAAIWTDDVYSVDWSRHEALLRSHPDTIWWCYALNATRPDLLAFWDECKPLYNLLVPTSEAFLVMNCAFDYHLIAGPRPWVEAALGEPLDAARQRIKTPDTYWVPFEEEVYLRYAARYEALDGDQ
jgi:hypothetical protein